MENNEQYDFFQVGQRHAKDGVEALKKLADSYEKHFGAQAREDFELGVASVIPQYSNFFVKTSEKEELRPEDGARTEGKYGEPNLRNNSYFGGTGYGVQYAKVGPDSREYNDPLKKNGNSR